MVGNLTLITVALDLKSSLPINSKFYVKLPNSVFYSTEPSAAPECKEQSQSDFGGCMQFTVATDSFGEYLNEVWIAST